MKHLIRTTLTTSITASLLILSAVAQAATVEFVLVGKQIAHTQTSATNVQLTPPDPYPYRAGPYGFHARVSGQDIASINAPVITGPISAPAAFLNSGFVYDGTFCHCWKLGAYGQWGSPTLADLDANFGSGVYTVNVNGTSVSSNLSGDVYPNTPIVTLSGGSWSGGKYLIDPNQALTITTNVFSAYGTHVEDHMGFSLGNFALDLFHSSAPGSNFLTATVPGSSLLAGHDYEGWVSFDAVVDLQPNAALPGSLNAAYYGASTSFVVSAVPVPAAVWLLGSGLIGLIGLARKRNPV